MNPTRPSSLRLFAALSVLAAAPLSARAVEVSLAQCPQAVRETIAANRKGGRIDSIDHLPGRGRYLVEIDLSGRRELDLEIAPDGRLLRSVEDMRLARVPAAVRKTVRKRTPAGGRLDDLEKVTTSKRVVYRVEIDLPGPRDLHLLVSTNGLVLKRSLRD